MIDRFGRPVTSLRVSVTKRCNLKCIYCHREGEVRGVDREMSPAEVKQIVEIAAYFGIRRVKITGGEPLLRSDICELVSSIKGTPHIEEVSMTTNGTLLADFALDLRRAGLSRVNVGFSSLRAETYHKITGENRVEDVKRGLVAATEAGLTPIKINMVVLRGLNESEVWDMIDFTSERSYILQLIELERQGIAVGDFERFYVSLGVLEEQLRRLSRQVEFRDLHNRRIFHLDGKSSKVELVRPFHSSDFCKNCTRMRLTSNGELKPCLMRNDNLVDILTLIREGRPEVELRRAFETAVLRRKPYYLADK
ncbi:MAG: GTP 3',8-cyclase MoaA [Candidatus Bathyarchaeia archaeon]